MLLLCLGRMDRTYTRPVGYGNDLSTDMGDNNDDGDKQEQVTRTLNDGN